jgi:hypothetical protein
MYSSNEKLIDEVKKRLISIKKNNYHINLNQNSSNNVEARRLSTLIPRKQSEIKRSSCKKKTVNILNDDKINLQLIPLVRTAKNLKKLRNLNEKIVNAEAYHSSYSRNNKLKSKKAKIDPNSNMDTNTFSNILSTTHSFRKFKIISKKHLFKSPYQVRLNKARMLKKMVDLSKELHSPKKREHDIDKDNYNIITIRKHIENKTCEINKKRYFFDIYPQMNIAKKKKFKIFILDRFQTEANENEKRCVDKIGNKIYQIKGINLKKISDKNKKRHSNKRLNCYYNKLRLNKVNNIIEKFSYNNKD